MSVQSTSTNTFHIPGLQGDSVLPSNASWANKSDTATTKTGYSVAKSNIEALQLFISKIPKTVDPSIVSSLTQRLHGLETKILGSASSKVEGLVQKFEDLCFGDQDLQYREDREAVILQSQWTTPVYHQESYFDLQPGEYRIKIRDENKKAYSDSRDVALEKIRRPMERFTNRWLEDRYAYNSEVSAVHVAGKELVNDCLIASGVKLSIPVSVKFDAGYGNNLVLCGEGGGLSWDPKNGKPMQCKGGKRWTCEIPSDVKSFKIVLVPANGPVKWEQGANRTLNLSKPQSIQDIRF